MTEIAEAERCGMPGSDQHTLCSPAVSVTASTQLESRTMTSPSEIVWGAKAIGQLIGKGEKATFAMLERGKIDGARKVAGRWAFNPRIFFATFETAA
ncbi:hypothetical protein Q2941_26090 [Bradyrhizobium sp. UFLA05-153]